MFGLPVVCGMTHCSVYRPMKRPSHWGAMTTQCSMGGRYRFAVTVSGALGLSLTSRKFSHAVPSITKAASTSTLSLTIAFTFGSGDGIVRVVFMDVMSEPHPEPEVDADGHGEVPVVHADASGAAGRRAGRARERVEARVVREQEQLCARHVDARMT